MGPGGVTCFKLIDDYARSAHRCFLTEFFPTGKGEGCYLCCFRPLGAEINAANRYACKYVTVSADQIESILSNLCIPTSVAQMLDGELARLTK